MNYHSNIIQKALLQCDYILRGNKESIKKITQLDDWFIEQTKPKNFDPSDPNNDVNSMLSSFEDLCANIEDLGVTNPYKLTVKRFYSRVRYYKKKHSKQGKAE